MQDERRGNEALRACACRPGGGRRAHRARVDRGRSATEERRSGGLGGAPAELQFDPNGSGCTVLPYDFHPMYSTASPATRVVWAAHSYNVAFSDEIGHFEYCSSVDGGPGGTCADDPNDPPEGDFGDDSYCFLPGEFPMGVPVGGCLGTDDDFDGVSYQRVWPGTFSSRSADAKLHPQPVEFTSPLFFTGVGLEDYSRIAFEADLPRIEFATDPPCDRNTGEHCVNPPVGANFYPYYTTATNDQGTCVWHQGGGKIPGTTNNFGGSSTKEYGPLLLSVYPGPGFRPFHRYNNFRRILSANPCNACSCSGSATSPTTRSARSSSTRSEPRSQDR